MEEIYYSNIYRIDKKKPEHTHSKSRLQTVWNASIAYFAIVFGVAFFLGAFRIAILVPWIGELAAVCVEMPVILTVSWKATKWTVRSFNVSPYALMDRMLMGFLAFVWLMLAELALSVLAFGKTPAEFVHELTSSPPHLLGLIGQILYGWMPFFGG